MANRTGTSIFVMLGLTLACGFGTAHAAFQSCVGAGYNISDNVVPNDGCTILLPLNDNDNDVPQPGFVNTEAFFTFTDWQFDGKYDGLGGTPTDTSTFFDFTGGAQSGTFTYVGGLSATDDVMLVFKDGGDTNLVGYLFNTPQSGTYTSPFEEPPFTFPGTGPRNISHISVYYRDDDGGPPVLPEPGSLALLGLGLVGLVAMRRRG